MLSEPTLELSTGIFRSPSKFMLSSSLQRLSVPLTGISRECQPRYSSVDTPMSTSDHPDRRDDEYSDHRPYECKEPQNDERKVKPSTADTAV